VRLAVVAPLVTPLRPAQAGGAQAFVADLSSELTRRGHDLTLYCAAGSEVPSVRLSEVAVDAEIERALVRPAGTTAERVPAVERAFATVFERIRADGADAVSQHGFDAEAIELSEGLPVLHTLHLGPVAPAVARAAVSTHAPLAVPSEACRRDWLAAGVTVDLVLRNGTPDFDPGPLEVGEYAVVAGRISPEKGTATAIEAARAAGLRPLVIGAVYDTAYHHDRVAPLLQPGELLPVQPRERLWRIMARAAVTLMPIEWEEPFGLVAAEAQVAGCPVVAYARGALPEVVEAGVSGVLVPAGDFGAFVAAIAEARNFERTAVRRSGRERLLIGGSVDAYERALRQVAA
jgi:glycosyltransferase involved in cell wall biosynthesis